MCQFMAHIYKLGAILRRHKPEEITRSLDVKTNKRKRNK
jgi:hypothetical protein